MPCVGLTAGKDRQYGDMVKLAATLDSNSSVERRIGSNPIIPTIKISWFSSRKRKYVPWRTTKCEYRLIHRSPTGDE